LILKKDIKVNHSSQYFNETFNSTIIGTYLKKSNGYWLGNPPDPALVTLMIEIPRFTGIQ